MNRDVDPKSNESYPSRMRRSCRDKTTSYSLTHKGAVSFSSNNCNYSTHSLMQSLIEHHQHSIYSDTDCYQPKSLRVNNASSSKGDNEES